MFRFLFASLFVSNFFANCALSQEWIFKKQEKAFGEVEATAMAIGDSSAIIVNCNGEGFKVSVATPEDWKDESQAMNFLGPQIILSIDKAAPVRYDVTLYENGVHKILAATNDETAAKDAAAKIASAQNQIDVGIEISGKRFYASRISAAGATRKVNSVLEMCSAKSAPATVEPKKP